MWRFISANISTNKVYLFIHLYLFWWFISGFGFIVWVSPVNWNVSWVLRCMVWVSQVSFFTLGLTQRAYFYFGSNSAWGNETGCIHTLLDGGGFFYSNKVGYFLDTRFPTSDLHNQSLLRIDRMGSKVAFDDVLWSNIWLDFWRIKGVLASF